MANTPRWKVEQEKRENAEKELAALKERIPKVLAEYVVEYGLEDTLCVDGLSDFCSRLGAAEYQPKVKGHITITVENIDLPGESNHYGITMHDLDFEDDLLKVVSDFLAKRLPDASWDDHSVRFERA